MGVTLGGYAPYSTRVSIPEGSDVYFQTWLDNYQPSGPTGSAAISVAVLTANEEYQLAVSNLLSRCF
jgi:hypothetical protein